SNQTNEIKNMMANLLQINIASTSGLGTLPGNTITNPKGELKAITTCSGLVTDGPTVSIPPKSVNPEEDECVEETYTDPDHAEYNIKVPPPPPVQKPKPLIQRNFVLYTRDSLPLHIPALVLMPKYQKMLKALLSNKEKLQELANTPLNENCSAFILKKLPEKLGDPGKFLIPCGFSELKCKALADLGASSNLMPLSVWKKLGLHDLILTQMTLELANRVICTPDGIARDVFVPVEMFTDEQPPDYSFPPRFDVYPNDFLEIKSDATFDDDSFDSEGEKIKEAELLIDQLDLPCDILFEYDSFNFQDFSRDDVLPSPDNEDK
nr:reverse transcriptase domain-containing protein [Tanacetum cinerariifolium]